MPHYIILTPWHVPFPYISWAITWVSGLTGISVGISFYRRGRGTWWFLAAIAFAIPLFGEVIRPLMHGLPPLPYGQEITLNLPPHTDTSPLEPASPRALPFTTAVSTSEMLTTSTSYLDSMLPLMAIAFYWAYRADKRQRAATAKT